ncbi:MAG: energy-coupling factor ABC transporter ATP-binding protein [Desulfobulbaceae bacterium]|nr:energy-coupling factor ABC transporter ATP-binding protein [Desulfobulbaceae bacterium]
MKSGSHLELQNIVFRYPGAKIPVYDQLDFTFEKGRAGLLGDNGSGKTTLFHVLVGLVKPDRGRVLFNGREMENDNDFKFLRRHVGMVFQQADDQLFSPTVIEDVAFGPLNYDCAREEAAEIASRTLKKVGLQGYEHRVTHRLSGGEKRLVALATVLAMEPDVLLLDEPTNDLDKSSRSRLIDILGELEQSYIIISHDQDFLSNLVESYYLLEKGKLIHTTDAILHQHQHFHILGEQNHRHHDSLVD